MNPLSALLLGALLCTPLAAQYINKNGDAQLLVPREPQYPGKITRLLVVAYPDVDTQRIYENLVTELKKQNGFEVVTPVGEDAMTTGCESLKDLPEPLRQQASTRYEASHILWLRVEQYGLKARNWQDVTQHKTGSYTIYNYLGVASALLRTAVLDLSSGTLTSPEAQRVAKEFSRQSEQVPLVNPTYDEVKVDYNRLAVRRLLQTVVKVHEVVPVPCFSNGALEGPYKLLKAGKLDEALTQTQALAAASAQESEKTRARIHYTLGLMHCMKQNPKDGITELEKALATGKEADTVKKALEVCKRL